MATWIVCGALALLVALLVRRMIRDRRAGRGACSCGGDCSACGACAHHHKPDKG